MSATAPPLRINLHARLHDEGVDLEGALKRLRSLYADVDERNERNLEGLELPCSSGCDACCHECVFLTPLEFYGAWDYAQRTLDDQTLRAVIDDGLRLYGDNREIIDAFDRPPPEGDDDHTRIALRLKFRCPLLSQAGECRIYPMREMLGRLFGCSFNDDGGVYGCDVVGAHLGGKTVTLVRARPMAMRMHELPLTDKQQVWPWYLQQLYGGATA
jgi:hypothetical protein